jgi:hypothetical protein
MGAGIKFATVSLAMNDPENGMPEGHADMLEVEFPDGREYKLEGPLSGGPVCRTVFGARHSPAIPRLGMLRLGRHTYRFVREHTWVGNWCWNAYDMGVSEAERLLANARKSGWWTVVEEPELEEAKV